MTAVLVLLVGITLIAGAIARWTRFHPLVVAALGGFPGSLIALLLPGETPTREGLAFAGIVYIVTTAVAALGAFMGWLRRKNIERSIQ